MRDHWTFDTIDWQAFDRTKVDPVLIANDARGLPG